MNLTERQNLVCEISDTFKSIHGIRPRWMNFDAMTIEQLREEAADLQRQIERDMQEEREAAEREAACLVPSAPWTIGDLAGLDEVRAENKAEEALMAKLENDPRMYPGEENTPWYTA